MTNITNEYLDELIKKKIFKDFKDWDKNDFHFLISLLNYPNYVNLALIILVNLKNWIIYSNGEFFYPIEKLQKILDKYYLKDDIFDKINNEENIKMNIQKKNDVEEINQNLIDIDLDTGILNFNDVITCDTFKFFIYAILFFIIFIIFNIFSYNRSLNIYEKQFNYPYNIKKYEFEKLFNLDDLENIKDNKKEKNKNFLSDLLDDKYITGGSLFKNIVLKLMNSIF